MPMDHGSHKVSLFKNRIFYLIKKKCKELYSEIVVTKQISGKKLGQLKKKFVNKFYINNALYSSNIRQRKQSQMM